MNISQKKGAIGLALCLGFVFTVHAQQTSVTELLSRSLNYFRQRPNLSIDMEFKMFQAHTSNQIIHEFNGYYQTSDNMLLVKMGGQTQLYNKNYVIVVDEGSKTILLQQARPVKQTQTPLGVDSLVHLFRNARITEEKEGISLLSFTEPKASFYTVNRFDVMIENSTGRVMKSVLYYAFNLQDFYADFSETTIPRIEINYTSYKENIATEESFRENRYVIFDREEAKVSGNYKGYRLIDLRK